MPSKYSKSDISRACQTLESVEETINQLIEWNQRVKSAEDYYGSQIGMQLLAVNCTLISAIGEGVNRINRILPDFLSTEFQKVPWRAIIGMRNHIVHGYFELDADVVFEAISKDILPDFAVVYEKEKFRKSAQAEITVHLLKRGE